MTQERVLVTGGSGPASVALGRRPMVMARTSGQTAVYVEWLTSGGEEFRRLAQPTARRFTITLCSVQVCAGFGYRCVPCGPLPQCGGTLGDRQMVAGIV
jgi:hypothetical protein